MIACPIDTRSPVSSPFAALADDGGGYRPWRQYRADRHTKRKKKNRKKGVCGHHDGKILTQRLINKKNRRGNPPIFIILALFRNWIDPIAHIINMDCEVLSVVPVNVRFQRNLHHRYHQ